MNKNKTLNKIATLTDVHFGKKSNSEVHNQDCLDFINWFCDYVRAAGDIDCVGFLGDWNENRSALNISTLNYSYQGAKLLNELGIPVFFIIGNHDLYHRNTREVHSVIPFAEFDNFVLIEEPTVIKEIYGEALFAPYLFHHEYPALVKYNNIPVWFGHFEFKGFEVTGYGMKMPTGPEAKDFSGPSYIFSGHFHKRQVDGNVIYTGNIMPMDFGDAGDIERGLMIYDFKQKEILFENWEDCPRYTKTTLTELMSGSVKLHKGARVKCVVDVPISFEESGALRQEFVEKYKLREFSLEESIEIQRALEENDMDISGDELKLAGVDELVNHMLSEISSEHISNKKLVTIYNSLLPQN